MPPQLVAMTGLPLCSASETFTSKPSRVESWRTQCEADSNVLRSWSFGARRMTEIDERRCGKRVSRVDIV